MTFDPKLVGRAKTQPKEDWKDWLTEGEREAERRHFESMAGRICNQCCEGWPCVTKGVYRSLAASRALVTEKDKALEDIAFTARALTEDDMLEK